MIRLGGQFVAVASCALLTTLALSSCGSETTTESSATDPTSSSPSTDSSSMPSEMSLPSEDSPDVVPPGTPLCTDVWQDGASLPRRYAGCAEGSTFVKRDAMACSSGQRLARYADRFYGVLGAVVHEAKGELDDDPDYRASVRRCRA